MSGLTPWRTAPARPSAVALERPRAPERDIRQDSYGSALHDMGMLEELSAELHRAEAGGMEASGLMGWLDEAQDMGGVNSYLDGDGAGVTLDDLENRLLQQFSRGRQDYDRSPTRDYGPASMDRRGRHRPDEERPPRREERPAEWGVAERATTREIDRLQEAYQRLQEEQRRRREGADERGRRRTEADRAPDPPGRIVRPQPELNVGGPVRPEKPSVNSLSQNFTESEVLMVWPSDADAQAKRLLEDIGSPPARGNNGAQGRDPPSSSGSPPAPGLGIRCLAAAGPGPMRYLQLLQEPRGSASKLGEAAGTAAMTGADHGGLHYLLSAGDPSTSALQYLSPRR